MYRRGREGHGERSREGHRERPRKGRGRGDKNEGGREDGGEERGATKKRGGVGGRGKTAGFLLLQHKVEIKLWRLAVGATSSG